MREVSLEIENLFVIALCSHEKIENLEVFCNIFDEDVDIFSSLREKDILKIHDAIYREYESLDPEEPDVMLYVKER